MQICRNSVSCFTVCRLKFSDAVIGFYSSKILLEMRKLHRFIKSYKCEQQETAKFFDFRYSIRMYVGGIFDYD